MSVRRPEAALCGPLVVLLVGLLTFGALLASAPSDASAQSGPTTTIEDDLEGNLGRIIPRPNSGREPESPSDRGGWQQLATLAVMATGVAAIAVLVVRESKRARAPGSGKDG